MLDVDELGCRVAGWPSRARGLADVLDAVRADEPGREAAHAVGGRAAAVRLRPRHHGFGVGERRLLLG